MHFFIFSTKLAMHNRTCSDQLKVTVQPQPCEEPKVAWRWLKPDSPVEIPQVVTEMASITPPPEALASHPGEMSHTGDVFSWKTEPLCVWHGRVWILPGCRNDGMLRVWSFLSDLKSRFNYSFTWSLFTSGSLMPILCSAAFGKGWMPSGSTNVSACLHVSVWFKLLDGKKNIFFLNSVVFLTMDEQLFSLLLFDSHICSYWTEENVAKKAEEENKKRGNIRMI